MLSRFGAEGVFVAFGQLDLSLRTLQRRVRALMDLAGARTRVQLGWHAARNGWA